RRDAGLRTESGGLLDGEREIAESGGEPVSLVVGQVGVTPLQQLDALRTLEDVHLEWSRETEPLRVARRDQNATRAPTGEVGQHFLRAFGVVEYQEPVGQHTTVVEDSTPKRVQYGADGHVSLGADAECETLAEFH